MSVALPFTTQGTLATAVLVQAVRAGPILSAMKLSAPARVILAESPGLLAELKQEDKRLLISAASDNRLKAVRTMLALGFEIGLLDADGGSALHMAAWKGDQQA